LLLCHNIPNAKAATNATTRIANGKEAVAEDEAVVVVVVVTTPVEVFPVVASVNVSSSVTTITFAGCVS